VTLNALGGPRVLKSYYLGWLERLQVTDARAGEQAGSVASTRSWADAQSDDVSEDDIRAAAEWSAQVAVAGLACALWCLLCIPLALLVIAVVPHGGPVGVVVTSIALLLWCACAVTSLTGGFTDSGTRILLQRRTPTNIV
jgi:hypothetical protein